MKRFVSYILAVCMLVCLLGGCAQNEPEQTEQAEVIRVGALTGPTAMGLVKLMDDNDNKLTENNYEFSLQSEAAAFAAALAKGETDIAAVPANLASFSVIPVKVAP